MKLLAVGLNHKTATVEIREKIAFSTEQCRQFLVEELPDSLQGAVVVSTCNRTELYGLVNDDFEAPHTLIDSLISFRKAKDYVQHHHFYTLQDNSAIEHLLEVAAGIDSLMVGDVQILTQLRDMYEIAVQSQTAKHILNTAFQTAFRVGKRVKTETQLDRGAVSVSLAAVELSEKIFDNLATKRALLIGAGETAELTAKHLTVHGIGTLWIANRTFEKAETVATQFKAQAIPFDEITTKLAEADIIISSVSSPDFVLRREQLAPHIRRRFSKPLLIIDIGIPRNIDPKVADLDNVFLEDIDSLNQIAQVNYERRLSEIPAVKKIIADEATKFNEWFATLRVAPIIKMISEKYEDIRLSSFERYRNKFSPQDLKKVDELTKAIVYRLLSLPVSSLRDISANKAEEDSSALIESIHVIFDLVPENEKNQ